MGRQISEWRQFSRFFIAPPAMRRFPSWKRGMALPAFDHNGVLPPFVGVVTDRTKMSPYQVTISELCSALGKSPQRKAILRGFLELRKALRLLQFTNSFHWIDGSFVEDVESRRGRPPADIDVITFGSYPLLTAINTGKRAFRGGLTLEMPKDVALQLPWPGTPTLNEVAGNLGAVQTDSFPDGAHRLVFGTERSLNAGLRVICDGWRGGVSPAGMDMRANRRIRERTKGDGRWGSWGHGGVE